MSIQDVINGYAEALLWANTYHYVVPSDDESMDPELELHGSAHVEFDFSDFDEDDQNDIRSFVEEFVDQNREDYKAYLHQKMRAHVTHQDLDELFGHDLLLTRSGHGAGFWDRGLGELGDRLSEAAKVYGDTSAEVQNGKIVLVES